MRTTLIFLIIFYSMTAFGQGLLDKSVITEGRASISIKPEIVAFYIDFSLKNPKYDICSEKALSSISDLKKQLKESNIDENLLKTLYFSIREEKQYNRVTQEQEFVGYTANIKLLIKLNANDLGVDKVYGILKNNLKTDYDLKFELSDNQIESAKDKLIKLAIKDARNKAQVIAQETGVALGDVIKIQYGDPKVISNFINPGFELLFKGDMISQLTSASSMVMNSLTPQDIEIKTNIVVGWEIIME